MREPLVSIIILTYNGEEYISDCLNSVLNQSYNNIEIIVIDNASKDKTVKILRNFQFPKIKIIANKKNLGFGAGHNIGIKESRSALPEFILCLNQDVVLNKDFVDRAVELFLKDSKIGAIQGKLLRWELGIIDTTGLVILKNHRIINRGQGEKDIGQYEKIEEIFGADGAAPVYRREALEDVKIFNSEYFDGDFFAYKEDIDLSWRLRLYGWKIVYNHKSIAWHKRKAKGKEKKEKQIIDIIQSRKELPPYIQYYSFKNQRLMQIKNELPWLFLKHLPWILPKEITSWLYILFFERKTWPVIKELFSQIPTAWHKRKIIMANRKVKAKEMERWFQ